MDNIESLTKEVEVFKDKISSASKLIDSLSEANSKLSTANEQLINVNELKKQVEKLSDSLKEEIEKLNLDTSEAINQSITKIESNFNDNMLKFNQEVEKHTAIIQSSNQSVSKVERIVLDIQNKANANKKIFISILGVTIFTLILIIMIILKI